MLIQEGSWCYEQVGGSIQGSCFHHQNIDKLSERFKEVAQCEWGTIHGMEYKDADRFIVAYLWHFERMELKNEEELQNLKIFLGFGKKMKEYRTSKNKEK